MVAPFRRRLPDDQGQACNSAISPTLENPIASDRAFTKLGPGGFSSRFHALIIYLVVLPLAVTWLTLLRDARHSPLGRRCPCIEKRPGTIAVPGRFVLPASYAATCFTNGAVVLISILRGKAAAATGAVISNTPCTYSAVNFSTFTPSGSARVLSNTP